MATLHELLEQLAPDLAAPVFTHSSWTHRRADSYERLAFLGDSVLALAVTTHLYPRLEADRFGAGRLTKIRAQAVSGRSCRAVAERLGVPERLRAAAPDTARSSVDALVSTERVLASVIEAVIGACYLEFGYERDGGGGRRRLHPGDRGGARALRRLQVRAAGAPRPARRARRLSGGRRAGTAARPPLLDLGDDRRGRGRTRQRSQQEGRRAGGRPGRTGGTRLSRGSGPCT